MRVAVFSDVHGNLTALEAVLDDIAQQRVDTAVFAGDLCLVGPRPAACVARLMDAWPGMSLFGNTDDWILGRQTPPDPLQKLAAWTAAQLPQAQRNWLAALPFSQQVRPTSDPADALLVVHANPQDVNQLIYPPEAEQLVRYGRVRQPDDALAPLLAGTEAGVIAFGHLHVPSVRVWEGRRLVNISSVSMAGDGDPRAKYGLFSWHDGRWEFERRFVTYSAAEERKAYAAQEPPGWERYAAQVHDHGVVPQTV